MLHMFCGKIAAGKSTLASKIAAEENGILISEDAWLHALYADQLHSGADYVRCSRLLRTALAPHVAELLAAGLTVVLDFQANTREVRDWLKALLSDTAADHRLHVLTPPDAVCLARLRARNASGEHPFVVTDAQFERISAHFDPPTPEDGFTLVFYDA